MQHTLRVYPTGIITTNTRILKFRGPFIVLWSYNKTNEMYQFLKFIFGIKLYMFRTVPPSIIRSLTLYTQQWCTLYRFC